VAHHTYPNNSDEFPNGTAFAALINRGGGWRRRSPADARSRATANGTCGLAARGDRLATVGEHHRHVDGKRAGLAGNL